MSPKVLSYMHCLILTSTLKTGKDRYTMLSCSLLFVLLSLLCSVIVDQNYWSIQNEEKQLNYFTSFETIYNSKEIIYA